MSRSERIAQATADVARTLERHFPNATVQNVADVCQVCVNVMATLVVVTTHGTKDATIVAGVSEMFVDLLARRRAGSRL